MIEKQELIDALEASIRELHGRHEGLFQRNVREEAITFHLAGFLYENLSIGERDLNLDIEYNKNQEEPKDLEIPDHVPEDVEEQLPIFGFEDERLDDLTNDQGADIRPDIVIHERGSHNLNILIAEIKKNRDIDTADAAKALCLTHSDTEYDYDYGAVVPLEQEFLRNQGLFWVENGEVRARKKINLN